MEHIHCQFCRFDAFYSPIKEMEAVNVNVYWCKNCHAEYLQFKDAETISSVSLYTVINTKLYRWTISGDRAFLWHVREQGIPGIQANRGCKLLLFLKPGHTKPEMTPDNVNLKIRVYLPFL